MGLCSLFKGGGGGYHGEMEGYEKTGIGKKSADHWKDLIWERVIVIVCHHGEGFEIDRKISLFSFLVCNLL